jgi:putative ABC transport system substrate-binding protein
MAARSAHAAGGDAGDRISPQHVARAVRESCCRVRPGSEGSRGQNVAIEYRYADNQIDRLSALVAELIHLPVVLIVVNSTAARAAKAATTTIPIVFAAGNDPVRDGLVASLSRPGGNVTGVSWLGDQLGSKRLNLLRQVVPKATAIGMLTDPTTVGAVADRIDVQTAAQAIGQQLIVLDVTTGGDIDTAFATFLQRGAGALLVGPGAFLTSQQERIVALAARYAIPAMYLGREAVLAGGLMGYGPSQREAYHQAGIYAGRILKGEKPADLPVMQSTKFDFVINLKTAKALGLDMPMIIQMTANEVIE